MSQPVFCIPAAFIEIYTVHEPIIIEGEKEQEDINNDNPPPLKASFTVSGKHELLLRGNTPIKNIVTDLPDDEKSALGSHPEYFLVRLWKETEPESFEGGSDEIMRLDGGDKMMLGQGIVWTTGNKFMEFMNYPQDKCHIVIAKGNPERAPTESSSDTTTTTDESKPSEDGQEKPSE